MGWARQGEAVGRREGLHRAGTDAIVDRILSQNPMRSRYLLLMLQNFHHGLGGRGIVRGYNILVFFFF